MIFKETGEVKDGFYVLGSVDFPVYLLNGRRPVLFDAGLKLLGPVYEEAIRAVLGNCRPEILFLTHVHFDHCGAVSHLKNVFPGLKTAASKKAAEIMRRPNAISLMRRLSDSAEEALEGLAEAGLMRDPFEPFEIEMILDEGEVIELETGLSVKVLATPGHTRDFLSYCVPERRILIASEAGGCAVSSRYVSIDCLTDFEVYMRSLRRLASLNVDILCQGHRFVYEGDDVKRFFERSIRTALDFRAMVDQFWRDEQNDLDRVMARIKSIEYDPLPLPKQPEPAYLLNLEARVKSVIKA